MRLEKLPAAQAERYATLECPSFDTTPWVEGPPLARRRVAIVSSAGLVVRGERPFRGREADYRVIPGATRADQLLCSHISINFDRTGFQQDLNVVFPIDVLRDLQAEGLIGGIAKKHIGYMGYTMQLKAMYEGTAREIANDIDKGSRADAVVLTGG